MGPTLPILWCWRWWLSVLLCSVCSLLLAAPSPSHVRSLAFLEDPSATLTLDQVRGQPLTPYEGLLSRGYSDSATWIRVRIDPDGLAADDSLIVRVRPAYLDEVRVFDPRYSAHAHSVFGDRYPVENDSYPSLYFNTAIPVGEAPREIWLRLKSLSTSQIHVDVLPRDEALRRDRSHELMFMLYLTALLLFFGWGLVSWLSLRETVMGVFVVKQFMALSYSLAYLGYFRLFWPDALWSLLTPDMLTSVMVLTMVAAAILFDYHFLKEFRANRWLLGVLRAMLFAYPILVGLLLIGQVREALQINNLLVISQPLFSVMAALSIPSAKQAPGEQRLLPKPYVVMLYVLVLLCVSVSSLPAAGLVRGVEWTFSGYLMYSLITGSMVLVILQIRASYMRKQRVSLAAALQTAEQRAELEETRRREQGRFLAMLTHELKTPLAVIRMVLGAPHKTPEMLARAEYAISSMGAVIERTLEVDRLEDNRIETERVVCDAGAELDELVKLSGSADRIDLQHQDLPPVSMDVSLFRMVVANLLDNALKYGAEGAPVQLLAMASSREGVAGIAVVVSNLPGKAGWPDPRQLFHKYYRHPRARKETGSGLGLFLVDGLTRLMQGHIDYLPTDKEIRFQVWIPLH